MKKNILLTVLLTLILTLTSCSSVMMTPVIQKNSSIHNIVYTFRLHPGENIKKSLLQFAKDHDLKASSIITAVGSVTEISIRYANQSTSKNLKGHFEITSLTGTLSKNSCHIHVSVADENGQTFGGHLTDESRIYTTLEITLLEQGDLEYTRDIDSETTYPELQIIRKNN